jgi:glucose-6-phosphate dehydrogenase assembly protein OpcA
MPTNYKVLGQVNPAATTLTTLYTVPSATQAVVSTIVIANLTGTSASFRIAIRIGGASISNSQYIAYDVTVGAADSTALTLGLTLGAADVISVYGSINALAFMAFGSEIS